MIKWKLCELLVAVISYILFEISNISQIFDDKENKLFNDAFISWFLQQHHSKHKFTIFIHCLVCSVSFKNQKFKINPVYGLFWIQGLVPQTGEILNIYLNKYFRSFLKPSFCFSYFWCQTFHWCPRSRKPARIRICRAYKGRLTPKVWKQKEGL